MTTMQRLRPSQVLGVQAELRERLARPNPAMVEWVQGMATAMGRTSNELRQSLMFYPFEPWRGDEEAAQFLRSLARGLFSAQTYQITEKMVGVLDSVYWNTLKEGAEAVEEELLPSVAGFMWYDRPAVLHERTGGEISLRAISWSPQVFVYPRTDAYGRETGRTLRDGIRIQFWAHADDPTDYPEVMQQNRPQLGELQLDHSVSLAFGERYPVKMTRDEDGVPVVGDSVLHWAMVTWMLLDTEIAGEHRQRPERGTRIAKQVARSLKHNEVRVITLRRSSKPQDSDHVVQHRDVDWTCCWVVDGFWRHIESYDEDLFKKGHQARTDKGTPARCTVCGAKITRVKSHIRGPDWKPLRNPDRLYLLKR
jgi:hypothetical protein